MTTFQQLLRPALRWQLWAVPAALAVLLVVIAQFNFLAFHTFAELFAIVISFILFSLAWSTHGFSKNSFLLFLACGYFWIGSLDLMHTLVYKGMNVFIEDSGNLGTQFWIGTRYLESLLLLAAPFVASRNQNRYLLMGAFGGAAVSLTVLVFSGNFPEGFIEGKGLTDFKIYSEYLIIFILALALIAILRYGRTLTAEKRSLIALSIIFTMCAELAFTFYVSVYGFSNLAGHIFKLFSFWLIFQAIVITNLREPYIATENANDLLEQAERLAGIGHWVIYVDTGALYWSDEVYRIHGLEVGSEIDVENAINFYHPDDRDEVTECVRHAIEEKENFDCELRTIRPDGEVRDVHAVGVVRLKEDGDVDYIFGIFYDVTERKQTEAQLIQSSKLATLGEMATSVAHELNQPLNITHMAAESLLEMVNDGDIPAEVLTGKLERILDQTDRASGIINHLRTFGRTDSTDLEVVDTKNAVQGAAEMLSEDLRLNDIVLKVNLPETCRNIIGHQLQLEQVMLNLLTNARDAIIETDGANDKAHQITINIMDDLQSAEICITVQDTGGGMDEAILSQIFEPFFTTKAAGHGTGLGLSISYGIIAEMGGRIEAANVGNGTLFTIALKAADETALRDAL